MPADELVDTHSDLETLWARSAVELRERLCAVTTPAERFRVLESALIARLRQVPERRGAVRRALEQLERPGTRVLEVANRVGLSHRHFIQVFTHPIGMTPKLYCRVRRFQRASALARGAAAPQWTQLSLDCGYFDQSHMLRDFRAFTGLSPEDSRRHRSVNDHHVALPAS
jgi:transcriptional regulator GlxA family with amidase domain